MHLFKLQPVILLSLVATLVSGQFNVSNNASDHLLAPEEPLAHQQGPYYQASDSQPPVNQQEDATLENFSFKLMNAPKERVQAVQNLVDSQQLQSSSPKLFHSDQLAPPVMPQCHHKGQQYKHGESVPIDDQPCLNCTCHRAVLQCYLRVCPPIHSANAERRHIDSSPDVTRGRPKCRMHKEANQCCPALRCEHADATHNRTTNSEKDAQASATTNSTIKPHPVNLDTDTVSASHEPVDERASSKQTDRNHVPQIMHNRSIEQRQQDTQLQIHQATDLTESPTSNVPKLTVINGATGQRDSILLITSNPGSQTTERPISDISKGDFSNALIEALLDTVYSSGAQLSGLNLEGSCMINGSLYIEGSAVISEGNAFCQYCYCIRQKIMCVRPKCQLIISGCTPRYSNEYACCPTSFSCSQTSFVGRAPLSHRSSSSLELTQDQNQTQALSARLWSAIESLTKHLGRATRQNLELREIPEQPANTTTSPSDTTTSPVRETTTTTTTTSTTTTTMSTQQPTSTETVDTTPGSTTTTEPTDTSTEFGARINPRPEPAEPVELSERSRQPESIEIPATTTSTEQSLSSVSDFLEPMSKLGPLVVSPVAPSSCIENGRHYSIGEQIPTLESCKHCYCGLDGFKECKMVECSLKIAHNCRPVTPEGHCCPVRYECPSSSGQSTGARYRSEPLCNGEPSDGPECRTSGLKTDDSPIELNRTSSPESLTEELNKFIMRINPASAEPASNSDSQPNTEIPPQVSTNPFEPQLKSQEAAINEQNSQIVFQDYPAITQVSMEPLSTGTISPEKPPAAEVISGSPPTSVGLSSTTQTIAAGYENEAVSVATTAMAGVGGQRDSRSTDSRFQTLNELLEEHKRRNLMESAPRTNLAEYSVDLAQPAQLDESGLRLLGRQRAINHSNMVIFDDELFSSHNLANNTNRPGQPPANEFITGNLIEPTTSTSTDSNNLDTSTPFVEPNSTPESLEITTTGTPLGLAADRSPETRGWLQSLQGLVSSFGRRLTGSTPVSSDAGAPQISGNELQSAASGPRLTGETARSRSPSLFNQILKSVIGSDDDTLVMRPLTGASMSTHNNDQVDLTAVSSGSQVSAALSSAPAEIAGTEISARSAIASETLIGSESSPQIQIHRMNNSNKLPNRPTPTHASLTCYEPLTNRTYLANEIIPKDDPCKTCTCVLGEELCQNLVCPEKPGTNCKIEERPGECCPNYLCGNEVLNSLPIPRVNLMSDSTSISDLPPQHNLALKPPQLEPFNYPIRRIPLGPLHNIPPQRSSSSIQQANNLNNQMVKPNLSLQQLRVPNNLATFLPPHLRFRPNYLPNNNVNQNPQNPLLYADRNKILFNNQRLQSTGDFNANKLASFNSQRLNQPLATDLFPGGFPYSGKQVFGDHSNNRGPTNIRVPILMHPHHQQQTNNGFNSGMHQMLPPLPSHPPMQQQTNIARPFSSSTINPPLLVTVSQPQQVSTDSSSHHHELKRNPFELSNELQDNNNKDRVLFPNQLQPDFDSGFKPINSPSLRPISERIQPQTQPPSTPVIFTEISSSSTEQSRAPDYSTDSPATTSSTTPTSSTQESTEFDSKIEGLADGGETSSSADNLLSMFKVSECNIYGHIYKVGEIVDSISNSCKRCTCSSTGVDCRHLCA